MQWSISKRPKKLSDLYGLDGIKTYFNKAVAAQDFPKATLLRGQFGSGKTTTAKIIACMLVCQAPDEAGNPCCTCASCLSIVNEAWDRDVMMIDGGQAGKADVIELVNDFIATSPFRDKRKVCIIEEVQQLSTAAKNSLLKTLESPRERLHFILLSMEEGGTSGFASRCVPFNLKKSSTMETMVYLKGVLESEGLWQGDVLPKEFKLQGLATLAQVSGGSLRQALQYLELCIRGEYFTAKQIADNLGVVDEAGVADVLILLLDKSDQVWPAVTNTFVDAFGLAFKIVADACMFNLAGYIEDEGATSNVNNAKRIAGHPNFPGLKDLFMTLGPLSKPFLRKAELILHLANFVGKSMPSGLTRLPETQPSSTPIRTRGATT